MLGQAQAELFFLEGNAAVAQGNEEGAARARKQLQGKGVFDLFADQVAQYAGAALFGGLFDQPRSYGRVEAHGFLARLELLGDVLEHNLGDLHQLGLAQVAETNHLVEAVEEFLTPDNATDLVAGCDVVKTCATGGGGTDPGAGDSAFAFALLMAGAMASPQALADQIGLEVVAND